MLLGSDIVGDVEVGSITLIGQYVIGQYVIPCNTGVFDITGQTAGVLYHRIFSVSPGVYIVTGSDVILNYIRCYLLTANGGNYLIRGKPVVLEIKDFDSTKILAGWSECDECGFDFLTNVLLTRWDKAKVCPRCFEAKHPLDDKRRYH
jgi:hypothetical protein